MLQCCNAQEHAFGPSILGQRAVSLDDFADPQMMLKIWKNWPSSAKWCVRFTVAQLACCLLAHLYWPIGPYYLDVNRDEIALFTVARYVLVVPLLLLALFHFRETCSRRPRHRVLVICRVSMWEFTVKIAYYTLLSEGYDFAFWNQPLHCQVVGGIECIQIPPLSGNSMCA